MRVSPDGFTLASPGAGLAVLDPAQTALRNDLEAAFLRLAAQVLAPEVVPPALLPVAGLAELDYFKNFPHLCVTADRFSPPAVEALGSGMPVGDLADGLRQSTGFVLPSATCYGVLLALRDQQLATEVRLTAVGRCYRNEDHFDGLRRLWGFHMREVVYVGTQDGADAHLKVSRTFIEQFAALAGLELTVVAANDPFYDTDGSRATLTALDPVKHEFLAPDGTAIASVNRHRNFFGTRLDITHEGRAAYSSCTAFGIERWIHALTLAHGSAEAARDRLARG
ncbi:hypothetical protein Lfu02_03810 [Longispora fulva]|uniref:Threonyl-tRNA synthetase n=1 Tax=Longispora fulva TaxID=619741 RepID=A0A8J7KF52_9ACTN|nr:aminoacyl--tRNA ligase-related protein [Longispora fulva]MBG6135750.1 threonyl-tRNA synthetase [Longispora fulva]GIG56009.1 hypothetical protein Lfu02_03810 [Longispora fulva]